MLKHFLAIGFRNLGKNKILAGINLVGLILGFTVCILIGRYVVYERSYDQFYEDVDNIYRVTLKMYNKGEVSNHTAENYRLTGPTLLEQFPEVVSYARLSALHGTSLVRFEDAIFTEEENIYFADSSLFQLFSVPALHGNVVSTLNDPYKVAISEKKAKAYFGEENPIGNRLFFNLPGFGEIDFIVGAVFEDLPDNSHLKFDILLPIMGFLKQDNFRSGWSWWIFYTYIKVKPGTDIKALEAKLPEFAERNALATIQKEEGEEMTISFHLQQVKDIHLHSSLQYEYVHHDGGNARTLNILLILGIQVLLIALFNFINYSITTALGRSKEVGVKKAMGASIGNLRVEFLIESLIPFGFALIFSLACYFLLFSTFSEITGKSLDLSANANAIYWAAVLILFLVCAMFSGFYSSSIFSLFKPEEVLRGKMNKNSQGNRLKKVLLIVQFAFSIGLTLWTLAIIKQVNFMLEKDLGIELEDVVVVRGPINRMNWQSVQAKSMNFINELKEEPGILNVTYGGNIPGQDRAGFTDENCVVEMENGEKKSFNNLYFASEVGLDYFSLLGAEIIAGRNFSKDYADDRMQRSAIINESTAKSFGFVKPEDALNKKVSLGYWNARIIGVIKDYNLQSLKKEIANFIGISSVNPNYFLIKTKAGNAQSVAQIEKTWKQIFPAEPIDYYFLSDFFDGQYDNEKKFGSTFILASILAIIIASTGLFSFAAYSMIQRTKEIGIRKVVGASLTDISILFFKDFLKLLGIACIISLPIMYFLVDQWLGNFAYRISIGWQILLIPCLGVSLIALLTVGFHIVRAAMLNNPVVSLRSE